MTAPANRLRQIRIERSWTQEDLAAVSGLSLRTIQRIETGGIASHSSRKALAAAFDLSPQEIGLSEPLAGGNEYVDHPAPSSGLVGLLVWSIVFWITVIPVALTIAGRDPAWLTPVLVGAAVICVSVLGFSVWLVESTYYRLDPKGLTVRWGPSVRSYRWEDFRTVYWRKGVFMTRFLGPAVTPCVRLSNVVALRRRHSPLPLNLTPNDPEAFIEKIEAFAPWLTREMIR